MHRLLLTSALLAGCSANPGPRPCRSNTTCSAGDACIVGTCRAGSAVTAGSKRVVLEPDAMIFVFDRELDGEPAAAPLGAKMGPRSRLMVRFPSLGDAAPRADQPLERAWLVLDRAQGAQAGPGDVTLQATAIVEPWSIPGGAGIGWSTRPKSEEIAGARAIVAPRATSPIRIDVTAWAQRWMAKKGARAWGLLVEGVGQGYGVPVATGSGAGAPPRLELYVLP